MTAPIDNSLVADPQGLSALKRDAKAQSPESLRAAARQFEGLFTQMLLKSMRSATPQDSLFGSDQQAFYQDMFDTQLSGELSKGRGLGLADMLVQQLMKGGVGGPGDAGDAGDASRTAPSGSAMALPPIAATPSAPGSREAFVAAGRIAATNASRDPGADGVAAIGGSAIALPDGAVRLAS
ncbi:flagellar assembly peptidoglycan hydrolase FlgJ, partial [bacterium]